MVLHYGCWLWLCVIAEWSGTQRNLWKAIWLLAFVWSNPDRPRRKAYVFRAFVCPHITGQSSCVYSMGLLYHGHFSLVLEGISKGSGVMETSRVSWNILILTLTLTLWVKVMKKCLTTSSLEKKWVFQKECFKFRMWQLQKSVFRDSLWESCCSCYQSSKCS